MDVVSAAVGELEEAHASFLVRGLLSGFGTRSAANRTKESTEVKGFVRLSGQKSRKCLLLEQGWQQNSLFWLS